MTSLAHVGAVFFNPAAAFSRIFADRRAAAWKPLLICLSCSALLLYLYYEWVDYPWLTDRLYAGYSKQQVAAVTRMFDRSTLQLTGLIGVVVVVPLLDAILALYISLVARMRGSDMRFGAAFRLVCWAALPIVLLLPIGLATLYLESGHHLMPEDLNPVSLNNLIFHLARPNAFVTLLSNLNLLAFWQMALMTIGLRQATAMSTSAAAAVILSPYAVIYGGWLAILAVGQIG